MDYSNFKPVEEKECGCSSKEGETACCEPKKSPLWINIVIYSTIVVAMCILIFKLFV
jgi:hypothetical protein